MGPDEHLCRLRFAKIISDHKKKNGDVFDDILTEELIDGLYEKEDENG